MLKDETRLKAYRKAIRDQVGAQDNVVDIGTGTGVLAWYAAQSTKGPVYALEYFKTSCDFAELTAKALNLNNLKFVNKSSYNRPIDDRIDCLVTETIGPVGPEENIVELCFEFQKRYPGIKTLIPKTLSIFAEPIKCNEVTDNFNDTGNNTFNRTTGSV